MESLLPLAPLFLLFELLQLVFSERYLGIKQIAAQNDPRESPINPLLAFGWSMTIFVYGLWMVAGLFSPLSRIYACGLLAVSSVGFSLRRRCSMNWVLVILTLEGAVRIGLLLALSVLVWRYLY